MTDLIQQTPGLYFQVQSNKAEVDLLRTDVTAFVGPTARGPVAEMLLVDGWRHYQSLFGAETTNYDSAYSIRGFFNNGGQLAYVYRVLATPFASASLIWQVGELDNNQQWSLASPAGAGFEYAQYEIQASSPGRWANAMQIDIGYQYRGENDEPVVHFAVRPNTETEELLLNISPALIIEQVNQRSRYIQLAPVPGQKAMAASHSGPLFLNWHGLQLNTVNEIAPVKQDYDQAIDVVMENPEVGLLVMPDLYQLNHHQEIDSLMIKAIALADTKLDRQVLISTPAKMQTTSELSQWLINKQSQLSGISARSVAVYHPWIRVDDPLGTISKPFRVLAPTGHIAGLISQLDRRRGAHHSPANAILNDLIDVESFYNLSAQGILIQNGLNLIRCKTSRGLEVWGARTLANRLSPYGSVYIAHRRLLHLIVRACRRVAQPLVFDNNGPLLWLALVRAITTVLLQAFRAGALKGEVPEHAFRVQCDEENNPPEVVDLAQVICDIQLAPAVPMEFINLRISLSNDAKLEVVEA